MNTETVASRKSSAFRLSPARWELLYQECLLSDLPRGTPPGLHRPPPGVVRGLIAGIALGLFSMGAELFIDRIGEGSRTAAATVESPPAGPSVTSRK